MAAMVRSDGGEVGGERIAEEGEERDGGEGGGDSREGDLVGRHGAPSVVNALLRNFWARHRSGDFGGRFRLQLASPCGGDSISCARSVARVGACFQRVGRNDARRGQARLMGCGGRWRDFL